MDRQVRKMILVRVLLVPFLIVLAVYGTLVYHFAVYSARQVRAELVRVAADHRTLIDLFLEERVADLGFIAMSCDIDALTDPDELKRIFRNLQSTSKAFFDLGLFDEAGRHLAYVGPYDLTGRDYGQEEWFRAVSEKGLFISDEFLGYRNIPHFIIAIRKQEAGKNWYIRTTIDTFAFNDLVESIRIGKTGEAYLVNTKGVFQSDRRSGGRLMATDPDFDRYVIDREAVSFFSIRTEDGRKFVYAAGHLKQTGWIMVVRQTAADAYADLSFAVIVSLVMIIGGGVVVLAMGFLQASAIAGRLKLADMEKQQMKTQLVIAGKLAEVGEMSTGLAHEINNPLQVMKSELAMINVVMSDIAEKQNHPDPEDFKALDESVRQIAIQIERCAKITQGLLRFARKSEIVLQPVDIGTFISEVVDMVEQRAGVENIRIIQELQDGVPPVTSDPNQLQQVFLNLFNNAMYALKGKTGAEIRVRTLQDGDDLVITVADNGCGITPEDMEKIYLPFFTTKPVGQGTGLGLSTVYGIIEGLGGRITVESEVNAGTVFTIRLPIGRT